MRALTLLLLAAACGCHAEPRVSDDQPANVEPATSVESTTDAPEAESMRTVAAEEHPPAQNRYDDYFGSYAGEGVRIEILGCTADLLDFEVSALKIEHVTRPRPPESGVAVRFELVRSAGEVDVSARTRWWSDRPAGGRHWKGQDDVVEPQVQLEMSSDSLGVRFEVSAHWGGGTRLVGGALSIPRARIAPFLDAWEAAQRSGDR